MKTCGLIGHLNCRVPLLQRIQRLLTDPCRNPFCRIFYQTKFIIWMQIIGSSNIYFPCPRDKHDMCLSKVPMIWKGLSGRWTKIITNSEKLYYTESKWNIPYNSDEIGRCLYTELLLLILNYCYCLGYLLPKKELFRNDHKKLKGDAMTLVMQPLHLYYSHANPDQGIGCTQLWQVPIRLPHDCPRGFW